MRMPIYAHTHKKKRSSEIIKKEKKSRRTQIGISVEFSIEPFSVSSLSFALIACTLRTISTLRSLVCIAGTVAAVATTFTVIVMFLVIIARIRISG